MNQSTPSDRTLICSLYQWALFIWLYSLLYPTSPLTPQIQFSVKKCISLLQCVPATSPGLSCLLFPLFIIGSASIEEDDRTIVSEIFHRLEKFSQLGNVVVAHRVVKGMWEKFDGGAERSWDWMEQLREGNVSVLVT